MKWKSNAKTGWPPTQEELSNGSIFNLSDHELKLSIHKYSGCGDDLFLTCNDLSIQCHRLDTQDFEEAVKKSKDIVRSESEKIYKAVSSYLADDSDNEFCKY